MKNRMKAENLLIFHLGIFVTIVNCARWSSSNYPNPKTNAQGCGNSGSAQICDPDGILSSGNRASMQRRLTEVTRSTQGTYKGDACNQKGITVYLALADSIQPSGSEVTDNDQQRFAEDLKNTWRVDSQCNKGVVITVSKTDKKFWTAKEKSNPISDATFTTIFERHKGQFKTNLYVGLLSIVNDIERTYENLGRSGSGTYGTSGGQGNRGNYDQGNQGGNNQPGGYDRGSGTGGSNFDTSGATKVLKKIPTWAWGVLAVLILSCLCCGCLCYCCCCRKKGGAGAAGGGSASGGGGGGGASNLLGGAGIGALFSQCLPRIQQAMQSGGRRGGARGGGQGGVEMGDYGGGGSAGGHPPQNAGGGGGGKTGGWEDSGPSQPMYPKLPKDAGKGGGGSW